VLKGDQVVNKRNSRPWPQVQNSSYNPPSLSLPTLHLSTLGPRNPKPQLTTVPPPQTPTKPPPPPLNPSYWRRYIYLWIKYAVWEELEAGDMDRAREVYRCVDLRWV